MRHLTPEILSALYRDDPREAELTAVLSHLSSHCACCQQALHRFLAARQSPQGQQRDESSAPTVDSAAGLTLDQLPRAAEKVREIRTRGRAEWTRLQRVPLERRRASIQRANSRYRNPHLVDLFLRASRERLRDDPFAALELAECAHAVALRLPEAELGKAWVMTCLAQAHGYRGNALRVLGKPREADPLIDLSLELFSRDGNDDPLVHGELLRFAASLRAEQNRISEAEDHLDQALQLYRDCLQEIEIARVLIKKASLYADSERPEAALALLDEARTKIDPKIHPQLALCIEFNQAYYLRDLGLHTEARKRLARARRRFDAQADPWTTLRFLWLEGTLALGLGELQEAEDLLAAARQGFLTQNLGYDAATVGLDLALVYVRTGATHRVAELAQEMVPTFLAQDVAREATAALLLFERAALQETVSASMLAELSEVLQRYRGPRTEEQPS